MSIQGSQQCKLMMFYGTANEQLLPHPFLSDQCFYNNNQMKAENVPLSFLVLWDLSFSVCRTQDNFSHKP